MKPLNIPRIRRLDLTPGYWRRRQQMRRINRAILNRIVLTQLSEAIPFPASLSGAVMFRRPPPFVR